MTYIDHPLCTLVPNPTNGQVQWNFPKSVREDPQLPLSHD